ncbi:MAG: hypothetical protein IVW52_12820 [Acidimicrobiales bacterium]|nr:hypothetical protein [Acidimicrobiales bacterium]
MTALAAFLIWLEWASHHVWLAWAPDSTGLGNHVVYGGNVLDCIRVAAHQAPLHVVPGSAPYPGCTLGG